jgi:cytosine/adenosine deaminase-related metal-dependent hydrolase
MPAQELILRSRVVLPLGRPPVEDGAVVVSAGTIAAVGTWRGLRRKYSGDICDLGESVLLPGLVNAHCHLDYTHMAGRFPPRKSFCDWIKLITTEKSIWTDAEFEASWREGAAQLLRTGTTTVADIEAVPELLPAVWDATPLRVHSLLEMTGIRSRRHPDEILAAALAKMDSLPAHRCSVGLSPHAPYSTLPRLQRAAAAAARRCQQPLATHVAESATEFEMFMDGRGEMFDWLARNERDMSDCGGVSPVQHLARCRALHPRLLAIHVNYLAPGDADRLADRKVNVVHCPRSHEYFGHQPFPFATLARRGVNICLGTDSLATVRKKPRQEVILDMFAEMRAFAAKHPAVSPAEILRLATVNGARALGLRGKVGELRPGACADLIALPFAGEVAAVCAAVLGHSGDVAASMIGGQWVIAPHA